MLKGFKHSEETKQKISLNSARNKPWLGKKRSLETKLKMGLAHKGNIPWNKGIEMSKEYRKKLSEMRKGHFTSEETKRKISEAQKGKPRKKHSLESRLKISLSHRGEKSYSWKGGITPINVKIRNGIEYRLWRESVFKRDNYTCVWCGDNRGGNLNADHIKPFCLFPELRFAIDNGRTLCEDCHKKTDTFGSKALKYTE